jgi:hypothetical protein
VPEKRPGRESEATGAGNRSGSDTAPPRLSEHLPPAGAHDGGCLASPMFGGSIVKLVSVRSAVRVA